jgi:quinol monooxygenase YgiN
MVILVISITARSSKRRELISSYRLIAEQTSGEAACLSCRFSQDIDDENIIVIEQTWAQRSDLDDYLRSDIFSALLGAVKLLGQTHEIRIIDGSQTEGEKAVEVARSKE